MPAKLAAAGDDRNAILEWNGGTTDGGTENPKSVGGYLVKWWPADNQALVQTRTTAYRRIQMQPLDNGRTYVATVAAIGHDGSLSAPSAPVSVEASSARVDQIRTRMNAFFDDFNLAAGLPDELKWNVSFAGCNGPDYNGFFINAQFHAHNNVSSHGGECAIVQASSRPRVMLDLRDGGTRTISFDFDGDFERDFMYVQLSPLQPQIDCQGTKWRHARSLQQFGDRGDIAHELRLQNTGNNVGIEQMMLDGNPDWKATVDLRWKGLALIPNVRRHWEWRVSTRNAEVLIDGVSVINTPIDIGATQYTVLWNLFSYNGAKANTPMALHHWDNFGFTAPPVPAPQPVTLNYRLTNGGSDRVSAARAANIKPTIQLNIPDSLAGATQRRLFFTLTGHNANWDAADKVSINGRAFPMPKPFSSTTPEWDLGALINDNNPYTFEMQVPDGLLKVGSNDIGFDAVGQVFNNIHIEADFVKGTEPKYTPPSVAAKGNGMPATFAIGPNVQISAINGNDHTWEHAAADLTNPTGTNVSASGTVNVQMDSTNLATMVATGSAIGIVEMGLLVDGNVVSRINVAKTEAPPSSSQTFSWNTTGLANGIHEVQGYACNKDGTASMFNAGEHDGEIGGYHPLVVRVSNGGSSDAVYKAASKPDIVGLCRGTARAAALRALGGPATDRDLCTSSNATPVSLAIRKQ